MSEPLNNTLFVGKFQEHFSELSSTQDRLWERLDENPNLPEGYLIRADQQSAGRGQRGTQWSDNEGKSLLCSIYFKPKFLQAKDHFLLTQAFALGLQKAVKKWLPNAKIKWPNDLLVGDNKICGMLIETRIQGSTISNAVLGFGINIGQNETDLAHLPQASSLFLELEQLPNINEVLSDCIHSIETAYLALKAGKHLGQSVMYQQLLYRKGERANYATPDGQTFEAEIVGVNQDGYLQMKTPDNEVLLFAHKEIIFLH